jgi:hypothetical protein
MVIRDVDGPATFLIDSTGVVGLLTTWKAGKVDRIPAGRADTKPDASLSLSLSPKRAQRRATRRRDALASILGERDRAPPGPVTLPLTRADAPDLNESS